MSFEDKVLFTDVVRFEVGKYLTADEADKVRRTLIELFSHFEISKIRTPKDKSDDFVEVYLNALKVQGRSEKTINRYEYILERAIEQIGVPVNAVTVYHLRKYLAEEKERGISDRTLESTRQVFSAFFNWLQRERLIDTNPTANLGAIKYAKKQKDIYSAVDMERMKTNCKSIRDRAIVCFLRSTGCRISEMTQLNRENVDFTSLECTVLGKGNKERTVYLDSVAGMILQEYLSKRKDNYSALFVGKGTDRLTPGAVRKMLVQLGEDSKVDHVHPHKFRRTTATNLIKHGMPIQEVAIILGHDKLDTTMQYVVLDKTDIKNSYQKYS